MGNKAAKPMQMSARAVLARRAQQQEIQAYNPLETTASSPTVTTTATAAAANASTVNSNTAPEAPTTTPTTVPISKYVSVVEGEGVPQIDTGLLSSLAKMDLIKSTEIPSSKDNGHLAVLIRVRKDEELIQKYGTTSTSTSGDGTSTSSGGSGPNATLVVGGGRLTETKLVEMMESMRDDPVVHNPVDVAERFRLGVHTAVTISTTARAPRVVRDADGNLYAI